MKEANTVLKTDINADDFLTHPGLREAASLITHATGKKLYSSEASLRNYRRNTLCFVYPCYIWCSVQVFVSMS